MVPDLGLFGSLQCREMCVATSTAGSNAPGSRALIWEQQPARTAKLSRRALDEQIVVDQPVPTSRTALATCLGPFALLKG